MDPLRSKKKVNKYIVEYKGRSGNHYNNYVLIVDSNGWPTLETLISKNCITRLSENETKLEYKVQEYTVERARELKMFYEKPVLKKPNLIIRILTYMFKSKRKVKPIRQF